MLVLPLPSFASLLHDLSLAPTSRLSPWVPSLPLEVSEGDGSSTLFGTGVLECMLSELCPTGENALEVIDSG